MPDDTQTPMLDRLRAVNAQSQAIGEFLEWLHERDIVLAEHVRDAVYVCATCGQVPYAQVYRPGLDDDEERRHMRTHCAGNGGDSAVDYTPAGLYLARPSTDTLLAEVFDLDLTAVERERRALLANLPR